MHVLLEDANATLGRSHAWEDTEQSLTQEWEILWDVHCICTDV